MNAKKCDVCGKLYETPFATPNITIKKYIHCYGERTYDLCETCQATLEKWLKLGGKNVE